VKTSWDLPAKTWSSHKKLSPERYVIPSFIHSVIPDQVRPNSFSHVRCGSGGKWGFWEWRSCESSLIPRDGKQT
jgi:hypothetical protein